MEEAQGLVAVVMRDAICVGGHRGVRKAGAEGQWELARVECQHEPGVDTRWKMSWPAELTSMVTFAKCMSTLPVASCIL